MINFTAPRNYIIQHVVHDKHDNTTCCQITKISCIKWKRSLHNKLVIHNENHTLRDVSSKYKSNPASFKGSKEIFSEEWKHVVSMLLAGGAAPFSPRTWGQKLKLHEMSKYSNEMSQNGERNSENYWIKQDELAWLFCEICPPPMTPPISNYLFIVKMEMNVYQTLQAMKINYITTGYRDMNIQALVFI